MGERGESTFWDADGIPRTRYHDAAAELAVMARLDSGDEPVGARWNVISAAWLRAWLAFAKLNKGAAPGMIDNSVLFAPDSSFRPGLRLRRDYRLINGPT